MWAWRALIWALLIGYLATVDLPRVMLKRLLAGKSPFVVASDILVIIPFGWAYLFPLAVYLYGISWRRGGSHGEGGWLYKSLADYINGGADLERRIKREARTRVIMGLTTMFLTLFYLFIFLFFAVTRFAPVRGTDRIREVSISAANLARSPQWVQGLAEMFGIGFLSISVFTNSALVGVHVVSIGETAEELFGPASAKGAKRKMFSPAEMLEAFERLRENADSLQDHAHFAAPMTALITLGMSIFLINYLNALAEGNFGLEILMPLFMFIFPGLLILIGVPAIATWRMRSIPYRILKLRISGQEDLVTFHTSHGIASQICQPYRILGVVADAALLQKLVSGILALSIFAVTYLKK
jgi:hypothetical protein